MKKTIVLGLLGLALSSCCAKKDNNGVNDTASNVATGGADKTASQSSFEVLKQDEFGGRETARNITIRSQQELNNVYSELNLTTTPKVDFTQKNVVALFMGSKSSGGYSIGVKSVVINGNTAVVEVMTGKPEGMASFVMTAPYCIATITKTDKVTFK